MSNSFSKIKFTQEGGLAIWLLNETGGNSVKGEVVEVSTTVDEAVKQALADSDAPMGITYTAGIAEHAGMWIVIIGIVEILADAGGFARHNRLITSSTAGRALVWDVGGAVATHFQEIGHAIGTAAANGLGLAVLHWN